MSTKITRNKKLRANDTVLAMEAGQLRFARRLIVKMWHPNHLRGAIDVLAKSVEELKRLSDSNSLRQVDKLIYAQSVLVATNNNLAKVSPSDPRTRGAERLKFKSSGMVDTNGHIELGLREDLSNI